MTDDQYMNFEQASAFLNTTRSTLYRWLREEKVPAHKLGRQWRFLRHELEEFRRGDTPETQQHQLSDLIALLTPSGDTQESNMHTHINDIAEQLLWHALDQQSDCIHITPSGDTHDVRYRTNQGVETLTSLDASGFDALNTALRARSSELHGPDHRRFYCERVDSSTGTPEKVQVIYQRIQTLAGERVTLRGLRDISAHSRLEVIAPNDTQQALLRQWSLAGHGLVLIAGAGGSGKTTTAYSMLAEAAQAGNRTIFTLESDAVDIFVDGINQVEVDLHDAQTVRQTLSAIMRSDPDMLFIASNPAQVSKSFLWQAALSTAEAGHVVIVQLEADSAEDALTRFQQAVERPIDHSLLGVCWQEMIRDKKSRRPHYDLLEGPLSVQ